MQVPFRVNLKSPIFPLLSTDIGRPVIVPRLDQNKTDNDPGIPQIYYCENVMPTSNGLRSISYKASGIGSLSGRTIVKAFPIRDSTEARGLIGIADDKSFWMYIPGSLTWVMVLVGYAATSEFSVGYVNGSTYVLIPGKGLYQVNMAAATLTKVTPVGMGAPDTSMLGCLSSSNYLILYTNDTIYWSSPTDPLTFTPSIDTGAGSGVPTNLDGSIILVAAIAQGFVIYTSANIILASYSGNSRYPWVFRQANNGSGIREAKHVSFATDHAFHYAYTASGLLQITLQGCKPVFPSVTDFLTSGIYENYSTDFTRVDLLGVFQLELNMIGSRYMLISYGSSAVYEYVLIYDILLERWGKLKISHATTVEFALALDIISSYARAVGTYAEAAGVSYADDFETAAPANEAPHANQNIGVITSTGQVYLVDFSLGTETDTGVLILGKYELARTTMNTFQELVLDTLNENTANFSLYLITSIDGKERYSRTALTSSDTGKSRTYNSLVTGRHHSLEFRGSFNLVSAVLTISDAGNR